MIRATTLAIVGLVTTIGCATAKEPFVKKDVVEASAKIEAIDTENRLLVMRGPGGIATIQAGPEIKNFDQINVGDEVKVTFTSALAAAITKSKEQASTQVDAASYTAPTGSKPAGAVGASVKTTVVIESVDTSFETVSFKRPDGYERTIAPATPEGKKFIKSLKKGDKVDVEYTEALAISVVPTK